MKKIILLLLSVLCLIAGPLYADTTDVSQPILVVDGEIYSGDIRDIDTQTIADITVLKSVPATGIFGERAAGGAIIISTDEPGRYVTKEEDKPHDMNLSYIFIALTALILAFFLTRPLHSAE